MVFRAFCWSTFGAVPGIQAQQGGWKKTETHAYFDIFYNSRHDTRLADCCREVSNYNCWEVLDTIASHQSHNLLSWCVIVIAVCAFNRGPLLWCCGEKRNRDCGCLQVSYARNTKLNCLVSNSKTVHRVYGLACHLLGCCLVFSWTVIG